MTPTSPSAGRRARLAVVGGAWRAQYYGRIAQALPEEFELVGMSARTTATREHWAAQFGSPTYDSVEQLVASSHPDLVVVAVAHAANEAVTRDAVATGAHVLAETPPATDVAGLRRLWDAVGATGRVRIAEQYPLLPGHAARAELVRSGAIGRVTQVQVSSTHSYHAVALIRRFLGAGFGPVTVSAHRSEAPLLDPIDRTGWRAAATERPAATTLAVLDFPEGVGVYDFTDNQWHNQLLHRRLLIRGTRGEIRDDSVRHLPEPRAILESPILRRQTGYDLNLEGYDTDLLAFEGSVVWRNPFPGRRFADEEIAIATALRSAAAWAGGGGGSSGIGDEGDAACPLAEALQDQLFGLAIEESARTGAPVRTGAEAWGRASVQ